MKNMKRIVAIVLLTALLSSMFVTIIPFSVAAAYDNSNTYTVTGFDTTPPSSTHSNIYVYPNTGSSARVILASDYAFRYSKLMIFNSSGMLIEAGENIYPNSTTVTGSPQLSVTVPAGGFMVAFGANATSLVNCYNTAMEGAMLYNATMSTIYEVKASYDKSTSKLTVEYNNPKEPSANALKFLFIGNSTTYFNGIPIKFKGMAQSAGIEIDVTYCTKGSSYLKYYADATNECGIAIRNALNAEKFDYVVLQDAGKATYSDSKPALDVLVPLIEANGAKPILYKRYASESDAAERLTHAEIHHNNYTQLAQDFNIDMVAPVADAFLISDNRYPEINLYADDNSHHSKEGSYLAALTFMTTFLGVDVDDVTYTADLPSSTVSALKECAKIACEDGYFEKPELITYENLTKGNSYTISATPPEGAPDTGNKELTDGIVASDTDMTSPDYGDARWVGLSFTAALREVSVVMPLGDGINTSDLYRITANVGTANVTGGCREPSITAYYSADGKNYYKFGTYTSVGTSTAKAITVSINSSTPVKATHIKLVFTIETGYNVCRVSEITGYGTRTDYANLTVGNSYTLSVAPPSGAPDTNGKELTNGEIVRDADIFSPGYSDDRWVGLGFATDVRVVDVEMPLLDGKTPTELCEVYVNFGSEVIGAGVTEPDITVYYSEDGSTYKTFGTYKRAATTSYLALNVKIESIPVKATHIKISFSLYGTKTTCRIGEIAAYGYTTSKSLVNVSNGSSYTMSVEPPSGAPDPNYSKLTDGVLASNDDIAYPYYDDARWVGLGFSGTVREVDVTIDLGCITSINEVAINFGGEKIGSGVTEPNITIYYSEGGSTYKEFGKYTRTGDTTNYVMNASIKADAVNAKYIKALFTLDNNKTTCRIGEIAVYGEGHKHTADANVWKYDGAEHWNQCSCGKKYNSTAHTGEWTIIEEAGLDKEGEKELRCTVCKLLLNTETIPAEHEYGEDWAADADSHWHECGCGEKADVAAHGSNIALNKTYTTAGIYKTNYPDEDGKSLTDGVIADADAKYGNVALVGFNAQTDEYAANGYVSITVDLGNTYTIYKFVARVATETDYNVAAGVTAPSAVEFYVSDDNSNWTKAGSATPALSTKDNDTNATLVLSDNIKARYIQYRFIAKKNWIMVSEVEAYNGVEWVVTDEAGLDKEGEKELQCTVCKYVFATETIPMEHEYSEDWKTDADNHWHECGCGDKADLDSHNDGKWVVTDEAGLDKEGEKELQCTVCGYVLDKETIPATHEPATNIWLYSENGHWLECGCGQKLNSSSHDDGVWKTVTEAELDKEGKKELRCTVCNYLLATDTIPAKHEPASEAWSSNESTHWQECACGKKSGKEAHDSGEWIITEEAGLDKEGKKELRCTVCEYVIDTDTIPALEPAEDEKFYGGDINESGDIDSMDYILLKRNYFGTYKFTERQFKIGDINRNGEIDSMDYILLKRAYFGTYTIQ